MARLSPDGPVYQAGTLSGNPLAMAAGIATLKGLRKPGVYERLEGITARLMDGLAGVFARVGVPAQTAHRGSMAGFFFTGQPVADLESAKTADTGLYARFFHAMLDRGVYLAPSQFEAGFLSTAHSDEAIDRTIRAAEESISDVLLKV
jgi:glutamate-1-semialdehyde 2,1-aminomutase